MNVSARYALFWTPMRTMNDSNGLAWMSTLVRPYQECHCSLRRKFILYHECQCSFCFIMNVKVGFILNVNAHYEWNKCFIMNYLYSDLFVNAWFASVKFADSKILSIAKYLHFFIPTCKWNSCHLWDVMFSNNCISCFVSVLKRMSSAYNRIYGYKLK